VSLGVPTIWLTLIQSMEAKPGRWKLPAGMRSLIGGSAAPESLIRAFAGRGVTLRQAWGMTKTSPLATIVFDKSELASVSQDEQFKLMATCGVPTPLVQVRLVGEDGSECDWNGQDVGEIQVRGPYITGSYREVAQDPEKFTEDGWLRTGDVAYLDKYAFLRISDRTKDLIKSGGEWISSVDLENAIMGHPAVAEAAVIAVARAKWAERPLACVVLKAGQSLSAGELNEFLASRFAGRQLPDAVEFIEAIPEPRPGSSGKPGCASVSPTGNGRRVSGGAQ
jgi:fatty-acyl-CoA synthase